MIHARRLGPASLAFALFLAGCGAGARGSSLPRPEQAVDGASVHALLPPDTTELLYANFASIRRAPFHSVIGESFDAWTASMERLTADGEREGGPVAPSVAEIVERTDWVLFSHAGGDLVVFVAARLNEQQAQTLLETLQAPEANPEGGMEAPFWLPNLRRSGASGEDAPARGEIASRPAWIAGPRAAVEIAAGLWVVAPRARVEEVLRRLESASSVETRTAAMDRRLDIFRHHLAGTFAEPERVHDLFVDEEMEEELPGWLHSIRSAGFTLDLSDGARAEALLTTSGANASWLVERELRSKLAAKESSPLAQLLGLSPLLRALRLNAEGEEVRIDLALGARDAALHWGRISGVIGAVLFVFESLTEVLNPLHAFSSADEGGDMLDWGDSGGVEGRTVALVVEIAEAAGNTPVTVGERCFVSLTQIARDECSAAVRCGERLIYGDEVDGPSTLACVDVDEGVFALDERDSDEDGDPLLQLNTALGTFLMGDYVDYLGDRLEQRDEWLLRGRILVLE